MSSEQLLSIEGFGEQNMIKLPTQVSEYFPYSSVRPHQDEFITTVYNAVRERRSVLIEGSNGLGKTISSLSAVVPIAIEKNLKILYVARTHRQHDRVIEELTRSLQQTPCFRRFIRGRAEMCLNVFAAKGALILNRLWKFASFSKLRVDAPTTSTLTTALTSTFRLPSRLPLAPIWRRKSCISARKKKSAPTRLIKSALSDAKVIALSYLYVFEPQIRQAFLKNLEIELSKVILIVDEAHNLPETAIDISSSTLSLFVLHQAEMEANQVRQQGR